MPTDSKVIPMKFHPRAFAAFGADLVTNDTVAITELVKNSYDAFAFNVEVLFGEDKKGKYIQIKDDGLGMTRDTIEESWAIIATPYKVKNPTITRDGKVRRVSGNKGLGRFSAARLGEILYIWTKNDKDSNLRVKMDWNSFIDSSDINECNITLEALPDKDIFNHTGTILRIRKLSSEWDEEKVDELKDNLSRLVSPFKKADQFSIKLISPFYEEPIEIKPSELIENPVYKIWGEVSDDGIVSWNYIFDPKNNSLKQKKDSGSISWAEARNGFLKNVKILEDDKFNPYYAGSFTFEIRAWDFDNDSMEDLTRAFDLKRRSIRNTIGQYMGLSIYRDNVLVLPKSAASKDWLGIDLRRVSSVGKRISTSQIIGIINISSDENPEIRDTTDREKLVDTNEYKQFLKILETVIDRFENLRNADKVESTQQAKPSINSLIAPLSAQTLVSKIEQAVERGDRYEDILDYVREYSAENDKGLDALQNRLTYYAQTASLGSIAIVILHEMLTGMTVIKRFLRRAFKQYSPFEGKTLEDYEDAEKSHKRLLDVAKSFTPLYRKDLRKAKNECILKDALLNSIRLIKSQKSSINVVITESMPTSIRALMHEGELQTIFINLLDNACYWLHKNTEDMLIKISCKPADKKGHLKIIVSDNGPGIRKEDAQSIFEAGVTAKPHGIGMGLVIVTEILDYYGGKIATTIPGDLGGATFVFDIPITK